MGENIDRWSNNADVFVFNLESPFRSYTPKYHTSQEKVVLNRGDSCRKEAKAWRSGAPEDGVLNSEF
jgi:hypothetical protein